MCVGGPADQTQIIAFAVASVYIICGMENNNNCCFMRKKSFTPVDLLVVTAIISAVSYYSGQDKILYFQTKIAEWKTCIAGSLYSYLFWRHKLNYNAVFADGHADILRDKICSRLNGSSGRIYENI